MSAVSNLSCLNKTDLTFFSSTDKSKDLVKFVPTNTNVISTDTAILTLSSEIDSGETKVLLRNIHDPEQLQDAVTKNYTDNKLAAGDNTQIQYNTEGTFDASEDFEWIDFEQKLKIGNSSDTGKINIGTDKLELAHDGTSGDLTNKTGDLNISSTSGNVKIENITVSNNTLVFTETGGGNHKLRIKAHNDISNDYTLVFPSSQGNDKTVMTNDGSGNLQWISSLLSTYEKVIVNTSVYTANINENFIMVNYTTTGTCTITLPAITDVAGINYEIVDSGGNAHYNHITINCNVADTISGDTSVIISENYNAVSLFNDSNNRWFIY